jgi:hypothetical protein
MGVDFDDVTLDVVGPQVELTLMLIRLEDEMTLELELEHFGVGVGTQAVDGRLL